MDPQLVVEGSRARSRVIARACMALAFVVVIASAWLRLRRAGLGCEPWPACLPVDASGVAAVAAPFARLAHRVAASLLLVGALALALQAATSRATRGWRVRAFALAGATIALAAVGAIAGPSALASVALANLLGGYVVLAAAGGLAAPPGAALPAWLGAGVALQVVLGAATSLGHEAARGQATPLWIAHALLALALFCVLLVAAHARRDTPRGSRARLALFGLAAVIVMQAITGLLTMRTGGLMVAWAHGIGAAAMVAAVAYAGRIR